MEKYSISIKLITPWTLAESATMRSRVSTWGRRMLGAITTAKLAVRNLLVNLFEFFYDAEIF